MLLYIMAKKNESISSKLTAVLKDIVADFGEGSIMKLKDIKKVDADTISTQSLALDLALGVGGLPRGRVVEIYGHEATGKTTLTLHLVAEIQKRGEIAAFIDAEHSLDPEYARRIGVDLDNLLISQPSSGEEALQIAEKLAKSGAVSLIIIDSVSALTPQAEIDGDMDEQQMGLQARLLGKALRKLTSIVAKSNTTIIFLNQIRLKIGSFFGNPETTTGGLALKFFSSVRIELKKIAQVKSGTDVIGSRIKAKVIKNKAGTPFGIAEIDIYYNEGISQEIDILNIGLANGIVQKKGNTYSFLNNSEEERLGIGLQATKNFLKENPKKLIEIKTQILEKIKSTK
jgi:recombination protein RecA